MAPRAPAARRPRPPGRPRAAPRRPRSGGPPGGRAGPGEAWRGRAGRGWGWGAPRRGTRRGEGRRRWELPLAGEGRWLLADPRPGLPCADVGTEAVQPDVWDSSKVLAGRPPGTRDDFQAKWGSRCPAPRKPAETGQSRPSAGLGPRGESVRVSVCVWRGGVEKESSGAEGAEQPDTPLPAVVRMCSLGKAGW